MTQDARRNAVRNLVAFPIAIGMFLVVLAAALRYSTGPANVDPRAPGRAELVLDELADTMSARNAETAPVNEEYVATQRQAAVEAVGPGTSVDTNQAVYLVQIEGRFRGETAKLPAGAEVPTGRYLYVLVDASTMLVTDWAITDRSLNLSSLGEPRSLPDD